MKRIILPILIFCVNICFSQDLSLVMPKNGQGIFADSVFFSWNMSPTTDSYRLQVAFDSVFFDLVVDTVTAANVLTLRHLPLDTLLYCHVLDTAGRTGRRISFLALSDEFLREIPGLRLWLRADCVVANDDNKVSQWLDKSPNDNQITQETEIAKPLYVDSVLNNQPVIRFNGSKTYLDGGDILDLGTDSHTFFIVGKGQRFEAFVAKSLYGYASNRYALYSNYMVYHDNSQRDPVYADGLPHSNPVHYYSDFALYTFKFNRDECENTHFRNGDLMCTTSRLNPSWEMNSDYHFLIGAYNDRSGGSPPQVYSLCDIAEIIMYRDILPTSKYNLVYAYLQRRYAKPVDLGFDMHVPYGFCDTVITAAYDPHFVSYEWSTGETDSVIHVNKSGLYSVTVTDNFGLSSSDDVYVFYPKMNELPDTTICVGSQIAWDTGLPQEDYTFLWTNVDSVGNAVWLSQPGEYAVTVLDSLGCSFRSDVALSFDYYEHNAGFLNNDTALCVGNKLRLDKNADETVDYQWNTGSTDNEIQIVEAGNYNCTVTNFRGCVAVDSVAVTLRGEVPHPNFDIFGHCEKNDISFVDRTITRGNIASWLWKYDDDTVGIRQNATYKFDDFGHKEIFLSVVNDQNCQNDTVIAFYVHPIPHPEFYPRLTCQYAATDFVADGRIVEGRIVENRWHTDTLHFVGDTITTSFAQWGSGNHLTLISESEEGCRDSLTGTVNVSMSGQPTIATFNSCLGRQTFFVDEAEILPINPPSRRLWDFGDSTTSALSAPDHVYADTGTYHVKLTVDYANNCVATAATDVVIEAVPHVVLDNVEQCENVDFSLAAHVAANDPLSYKWQIGDFFTSELQMPTLKIDSAGSYPIVLQVVSRRQCDTVLYDTLVVHAGPHVDFSMSEDHGAAPLSVDFSNHVEDSVTYHWDFGDDDQTDEINPRHTFAEAGNYVVTLVGQSHAGCTDTASKNVVTVAPVVDISLMNLQTDVSNSFLTTSVCVVNAGTLPVYDLTLQLTTDNNRTYRENVDVVPSASVVPHTFGTRIYVPAAQKPNVVCVEALLPSFNGVTDCKSDDNMICESHKNGLTVMTPYPIPTQNDLFCDVFMPYNATLQITVSNVYGQVVHSQSFSNFVGLMKYHLDVSKYAAGIYFFKVEADADVANYKFEVK